MEDFDWNIIIESITWLATQSPLLLAYLIGIVTALVHWRRYPKPAIITLLVCLTFLLEAACMPFVYRIVGRISNQGGMADIASLFRIIGFVQAVVSAGLWLLILWAIFGWRSAPRGRILGHDGQYLPADFSSERTGIQ